MATQPTPTLPMHQRQNFQQITSGHSTKSVDLIFYVSFKFWVQLEYRVSYNPNLRYRMASLVFDIQSILIRV